MSSYKQNETEEACGGVAVSPRCRTQFVCSRPGKRLEQLVDASYNIKPAQSDIGDSAPSDGLSDLSWNARIEELQQYKAENGNCLVPARFVPNRKLGHWVMTQRRQYVLLKEGKPSTLSAGRVAQLNQLGFTWAVRDNNTDVWNRRLNELLEYKKKNGDCLVPQRNPSNPALGTWVNTQRRHFKLLKDGKRSSMTTERIRALEKLGFVWKSPIKEKAARSRERPAIASVRKRRREPASTSTSTDAQPLLNVSKTMKREGQFLSVGAEGARVVHLPKVKRNTHHAVPNVQVPLEATHSNFYLLPELPVGQFNYSSTWSHGFAPSSTMIESVVLSESHRSKPWHCLRCRSTFIGSPEDASNHEALCGKRLVIASFL